MDDVELAFIWSGEDPIILLSKKILLPTYMPYIIGFKNFCHKLCYILDIRTHNLLYYMFIDK